MKKFNTSLLFTTCALAGLSFGTGQGFPQAPETTTPRLQASLEQRTNVVLTVSGLPPETAYDVYYATNLSSSIAWLPLLRTNAPSFSVSSLPWQTCFFRLGTGTDAANPDADGDLLPDGWELFHSLNPALNDAGADPDGDGLSNLQEYLRGSDPRSATRFQVFITHPNPSSILP